MSMGEMQIAQWYFCSNTYLERNLDPPTLQYLSMERFSILELKLTPKLLDITLKYLLYLKALK